MVQQMGCQYAIVRLTGKVSRSYHIDPWLNLSAEKNCQNLSIILLNVYAFLLSKSYQGFSTVISWAGQVRNKYSHLKIKSKNKIMRANQGFKKQPRNSLITMYFYIAVLSFFFFSSDYKFIKSTRHLVSYRFIQMLWSKTLLGKIL